VRFYITTEDYAPNNDISLLHLHIAKLVNLRSNCIPSRVHYTLYSVYGKYFPKAFNGPILSLKALSGPIEGYGVAMCPVHKLNP